MYTDQNLKDEIEKALLRSRREGKIIDPDWLSLKVIGKHIEGFSKHDSFVTNAVWSHVRKVAGRVVRLKTDDDGRTASLPGFERLQGYYEVERGGKTVDVPRMMLTLAERRALAEERRSVGRANIEHGNQLDRETDILLSEGLLSEIA